MEFLHAQLATLQRHLAFVAVDPIDWKFYVQLSSWGICLFESYLLCAIPLVFPQLYNLTKK